MDSLGHRSDLAPRLLEALAELSGTASTVPSYDEDFGTNREYTENSQLSPHLDLNFELSPPVERSEFGRSEPRLFAGN